MQTKLKNWLFSLGLDTVQTYGAIRILPLIAEQIQAPAYLSMREAMTKGWLTVSEVSQEGSVPNLQVRNDADLPVILLDGEELKGAKQNRILNTSVLIAPHSGLVVPVSCTEAGRWGYSNPVFSESGNILSHSMRASKLDRVSENLKSNRGYDAEQGVVWDEIRNLQSEHKVHSQTSAMHDVFEDMGAKLEEIASHFPLVEGQCGIFVEAKGKFVGLDLLSLSSVWKDVHAKIIRSYAIDFIKDALYDQAPHVLNPDAIYNLIGSSVLSSNRSVGLGVDHRFEAAEIIGSALVYEDCFVHAAIYPKQNAYVNERYQPSRRRF